MAVRCTVASNLTRRGNGLARIRGRKYSFCATVPKAMITGATIFRPKLTTRGQPARAISVS